MRFKRFLKGEFLLAGALAMALTPAAALVHLVFAPMCAIVAIMLFSNRPSNYISFTYWTWMITPLIRRVVDYHTDFHASSVVMTAPLLVTLISGLDLIAKNRVRVGGVIAPYVVYAGVVIFGFFIGAIGAGFVAAAFDLLNWILPAVFAVYLLRVPLPKIEIADAVFKTIMQGGLALGVYGIYQYFFLPSWDAKWIIATKLGSIGTPVPRGVRVFGPLNSPGVYAAYMMASILIMVESKLFTKWLAVIPAAIGLLLSLVRATWGGLVVGTISIMFWAPVRKKIRYIVGIIVIAASLAPTILLTPVGKALEDRVASLNRLGEDNSYLARQELYSDFAAKTAVGITGFGLAHSGVAGKIGDQESDAVSLDSGLLEIIFTYGIAGVLMLCALIAIVVESRPVSKSPPSVIAWSVALSGLSCIIFGPMLVGAQGMLILPMFALATRCGSMMPISRSRNTRASRVLARAGSR